MKKIDDVRFWLSQGLPATEVALRANCSLSLVYLAKGRAGLARLNHELALLNEEIRELRGRVDRLESGRVDIIQRKLSRTVGR